MKEWGQRLGYHERTDSSPWDDPWEEERDGPSWRERVRQANEEEDPLEYFVKSTEKDLGIEVELDPWDSVRSSYYDPGGWFRGKKIHLGAKEEDEEAIVTVGLHERGHAEADLEGQALPRIAPLFVLLDEEYAWERAREKAKEENLPFDPYWEKEGLDSYYRVYGWAYWQWLSSISHVPTPANARVKGYSTVFEGK